MHNLQLQYIVHLFTASLKLLSFSNFIDAGRLFHARVALKSKEFAPLTVRMRGASKELTRLKLYPEEYSLNVFHIISGLNWFNALYTSTTSRRRFRVWMDTVLHSFNNTSRGRENLFAFARQCSSMHCIYQFVSRLTAKHSYKRTVVKSRQYIGEGSLQ